MKRPRQHVLEEESKRAFINLLPPEWIYREKNPDYGIDMEVEIVEDGKVTNNVFWIQLKATESLMRTQKKITYNAETEHLKFWETERLPVLILYYIKSSNTFYYLFAQRYIRENLPVENPNWRKQKYATIKFPLDSKLDDIKNLKSVASEGYFYVAQQQLNQKPETKSATYWLDGIPKSDDEELKQRTLKALSFAIGNKHPSAIREYDKILKELTISPSQRMSVLVNLGNAYYSISENDRALDNYKSMLELAKKVSQKDALEGKAAALGNIGLIYLDKEELAEALKYLKKALKIDKEIGHKKGEASSLGNIGLVYRDKGELAEALKYNKEALDINKEIGYKQGEASALGNIGLIYLDKEELAEALKYLKEALRILDKHNLVYGRDVIQNAINSIRKRNRVSLKD
jgi:tetratricopeptide (TPR) repeat protein